MEGVVVMDPAQSVGTLMNDIANNDGPVVPSAAVADGGASLAIRGGIKNKSTRGRKVGIGRSNKKSKEGSAASGSRGLKDAGTVGSFGTAKAYSRQTVHTQQDTQRKLEVRRTLTQNKKNTYR